jgi:hypothetical protein
MTNEHNYTSSGRRLTTTPTTSWVVALPLPILIKKSYMGAKELQTTLPDTHSCTNHYETMWKEKERVIAQLYGTWEECFHLLFSWRGVVL